MGNRHLFFSYLKCLSLCGHLTALNMNLKLKEMYFLNHMVLKLKPFTSSGVWWGGVKTGNKEMLSVNLLGGPW